MLAQEKILPCLETDSEYCLHAVIHLTSSKNPQAPLIQACRNLVQRDWQCFCKHTHREGKIAADWLASEALKQPLGYQQLLTCPPGHKIPKEEEIKGKPYCKWHDKWTHSTNNCVNLRNLIQDYLDKGLFRIADRPMGIETSPFAGAVEINMMSADLRKLSDPQKQLEAAEHIPQESSPESVASHSPRPLPTTGLCERCQLEISMNRGEKHPPFRKRMEWRPVVREPLAQERRMTADSIALSTQLIESSCVKQHKR